MFQLEATPLMTATCILEFTRAMLPPSECGLGMRLFRECFEFIQLVLYTWFLISSCLINNAVAYLLLYLWFLILKVRLHFSLCRNFRKGKELFWSQSNILEWNQWAGRCWVYYNVHVKMLVDVIRIFIASLWSVQWLVIAHIGENNHKRWASGCGI